MLRLVSSLLLFWYCCLTRLQKKWRLLGKMFLLVLVLGCACTVFPFTTYSLHAHSFNDVERVLSTASKRSTTLYDRNGLVTNLAQSNPIPHLLWGIFQRLTPSMLNLLGMNGPRTYLVLVQNNHELRPTGGFISVVGTIILDNGSISIPDFVDSYTFFQETLEYGPAPKAMQQYMNIQLLLLRDANWSPDLPTSAKLIQSLYTQHTGLTVDGVITVDLRAAELFIDAIGPLELPGAASPITGDTFVEQVVQLWERPLGTDLQADPAGFGPWWEQRKTFVTALAQAVLQRLQSPDINYAKLLRNLHAGFRERSIQIWLDDPLLARQLRLLGWDGGLYAGVNADFVALIDTNMGYNKVDAVLQRRLDYTVNWPDGVTQPALATLKITYTHPISISNYICTNAPQYGYSYAFLIERCYYNYLRLYIPLGSQLINIEGVEPTSIITQRGENHTQYFAGFFVLPLGQQHTIVFQYRLPPYLTPDNYQLLLRRQAGSKPLPVTVTVNGETISTTVTDAKLRWPGP
jgi:hypothetical protein